MPANFDNAIHDWYRFVLSFPARLVRDYIDRFKVAKGELVLDPFCGTGTTLVECKKLGIDSLGIEANPMAYFATCVKTDWSIDPDALVADAKRVAHLAESALALDNIQDVPAWRLLAANGDSTINWESLRGLDRAQMQLLLTNSISPLPLHKALVLLHCIRSDAEIQFRDHELLALAKTVVCDASNLHFGPEVGVGAAKVDSAVVGPWLKNIRKMSDDIPSCNDRVSCIVHLADSREISKVISGPCVDVVITSPPYPNEKDYTRTTRLESVLLGFVEHKAQLRSLKKSLVRSNTRGVYKEDDDDRWIANHPKIQRIADEIERRRLELRKTSGFEKLYHRVTKLYFGGIARHLADLSLVLRPGARLAYVVGDQASYLRIMIRTGKLLAEIAESLGYEVVSIDLFRTRLATATKERLREEVVVLRWPG